MKSIRFIIRATPVVVLGAGPLTFAATSVALSPEQTQFFENKIRPILANHCLKCHSAEEGKVKGGLALDSREGTLKGGESGAAVKPGNLKESLLIRSVTYEDADLQMPPKGEKLSNEQIAALKEWVEMGAPDPREGKASKGDKAREHWAFKPVQKPPTPAVKNAGWCVNSIDKFILAKLEAKEMLPAAPAPKEALLRRAYFDLIGLPPSPQQILAFVQDNTPNAFEKVVDQLLASPRYGERWGRHWLDTARYSDTKGYIPENSLEDYRYPYAYTYRDWVIKAFNADMPYDQFVIQQLAADKIPNNPKDNIAALGLITIGKRFQDQEEIVADRIDAIGRGFLGLTLACARCHEHKFDPVSMKDYYALRGVFVSSREPKERDLPVIGGDINSPEYRAFNEKLAALEKENLFAFYAAHQDISGRFRKNPAAYFEAAYLTRKDASDEDRKQGDLLITAQNLDLNVLDSLRSKLRPGNPVTAPLMKILVGRDSQDSVNAAIASGQLNKGNVNYLVAEFLKEKLPTEPAKLAAAFGKLFSQIEPKVQSAYQSMANTTSDPLKTPEKALLELAAFPLVPVSATELTDYDTVRRKWIEIVPFRLRAVYLSKSPLAKISDLKLTAKGVPVRAMALEDLPTPVNSPVFPRGNKPAPNAPEVPRRFLEILSTGQEEPFHEGSGRLELANAIASKNNPLTARVLVNRVWMHHFGEGLVRTPDDLGNQAGQPTHPELLDFLATWFVEDFGPSKPGWSVKALHKAIMLSRAYQQSSSTGMKQQNLDPSNELVWRANIRRLDFESFRDSLLSMAGSLDFSMYGPPVNIVDEPYSFRRSVYGYLDRGNMPDLLMQFDMANPMAPNSKRRSTIVPQQALFLMNSPFVVAVTKKIVQRPEVLKADNDRARILAIYQIVLQRTPSKVEFDLALSFITKEAKFQAAEDIETKALTADAQRLATAQLTRAQNGGMNQLANMTKAIVNEGELVGRVRLSPWETLVQTLLFANEAAYVN